MSTQEVVLAVYDLSRGMARSLSSQLLGPEYAVDAIPHTGIVAYGHEYFFGAGAGIQREDPASFRRSRDLHPVQFIPLGRTRVTQSEFEDWCRRRTSDGSYAGSAYDLLHRNCNNFAHEAARDGLGLDRGVPEWILRVPQRFLASPVGMMMRPMLQNMQLSGPTTTSNASSPFASSPSLSASAAPARSPVDSAAAANNASASAVQTTNPWADLPLRSISSKSTPASSDPTNGNRTSEIEPAPVVSPSKKPRPCNSANRAKGTAESTPVLDSFTTKPLISSETSMIRLCLTKLRTVMNDDDFAWVEKAANAILEKEALQLSPELARAACQALLRALEGRKQVSFVLLLVRVLVLRLPPLGDDGSDPNPFCSNVLEWIHRQLVCGEFAHVDDNNSGDRGGGTARGTAAASVSATEGAFPSLSPAARAASWLVLGNALAVEGLVDGKVLGSLVDAALVDWNPSVQTRVDIRQAASSFLYNVSLQLVHHNSDDRNSVSTSDGDIITSILCFGLDGLSEENDSTCRLRRCMILGRLLLDNQQSVPNPAPSSALVPSASVTAETQKQPPREDGWHSRRTLAMDLGIVTVLTSLVTAATAANRNNNPETATLHRLAEELLTALV